MESLFLTANGQLHWTLAYGAVANGRYLWRNYKFLQIDNETLIKDRKRDINEEINYTAVQVWNPWFLVYD
ncbi:hypothetical protein CAPN008_05380 [Capnocytophaga canis]|uniref:hypothetical protein n=1 Tax=Capnocytophaga canis TaxID=1848903 RepID=UPI001AC08577|nr:hypothetical protein [Capnocytophaga canis]GIM60488.1 hypothetical protein CAPN008_05380 [Capnocytophaga canis]